MSESLKLPVLLLVCVVILQVVIQLLQPSLFGKPSSMSAVTISLVSLGLLAPVFYFVYKRVKKLETEIKQRESAFNSAAQSYVSSMKRIEQEKDRYQSLISSISDGVIATDKDGRITLCNQATTTMIKLSSNELIGKIWREKLVLFKNENREEIPPDKHPFYLALRQGITTKQNLFFPLNDQDQLALSVSVSPVKNSDMIDGTIMVFKDVSKEREVDRMKTEFISLASHQLRTPLTIVKWFSEILLKEDAGGLENKQKEFLSNILVSTDRMIDLVNDLLDISRLELGKVTLKAEKTNVIELVEKVIKDLEPKLTQKELSIERKFDPEIPSINLDPKMISQVYTNLLSNAIKYTPTKGQITITLAKKEGIFESQITDTGVGIPEKDQTKIFDRFFRAENVSGSEYEGSGLGLYLVKKIIEASGGTIWFNSIENKGTTFGVKLPA